MDHSGNSLFDRHFPSPQIDTGRIPLLYFLADVIGTTFDKKSGHMMIFLWLLTRKIIVSGFLGRFLCGSSGIMSRLEVSEDTESRSWLNSRVHAWLMCPMNRCHF